MSERKVVSAKDFINKAVKVVEIDGFEQGEKFQLILES